ncbi:hypothetical protein IJ00_25015 [Calothrix sp. 336/3]|nr:hypothetical protein IJ00_25015 [Calothrix sp. 336/3]
MIVFIELIKALLNAVNLDVNPITNHFGVRGMRLFDVRVQEFLGLGISIDVLKLNLDRVIL